MTPSPWENQKSLESCKRACYNQVECEGIIWGHGACHLRKSIMKNQCKTGQLGKGLTLLQKPEDGWIVSRSTNCYTGAGATSMTPNPWEKNKSLNSCKKACNAKPKCEGIVWGFGGCHLRKNIMKTNCKTGPWGKGYTLLEKGWIVSAKTNCYTGAGAISIEPNPWEKHRTLDSCKRACLNHPECEAIVWGYGACHLRKDIVKEYCRIGKGLTLIERPKDGWRVTSDMNCYTGAGAISITPNPWEKHGSLDTCKKACANHPECEAIVWSYNGCHLRKHIVKEHCLAGHLGKGYALLEKNI